MNTVLIRLLGLSIGLSGCQFFSTTEYASNDKYQYLKSRNGPDLVIQKPLTDANISDFYHLPTEGQTQKISVTPPVVKHDENA